MPGITTNETRKPIMKKCKHCQTEIPMSAKVCPNCRRKQGGAGKWIAIIAVAVIIIAVGTQASKEPKKVSGDANDNTKASNNAETSFSQGDTVELDGIKATLVSVTESAGSKYNTPADGKVFLLCEFNIENDSSKDITVSSVISFDAYCDSYSVSQSFSGIMAAEDKSQLDGSVAAGKKMNGVIAYEVPAEWAEIEINFAPDFWGKPIKFIATK